MNNKINNSGENISYEHLMFHLEQGREIEFVYQEIEYFICNCLEGRAFWIGKTRVSAYFDEWNKDLVNFKLDEITLGGSN